MDWICLIQPQQQKQFAITFCTTSYRTEMEAKHCMEKIFSGIPTPLRLSFSVFLFTCFPPSLFSLARSPSLSLFLSHSSSGIHKNTGVAYVYVCICAYAGV